MPRQKAFFNPEIAINLLGVLALADIFILGISRAEAADNAVVFGLIALLALLGSHAWLFARYLRANYPEQVRSLAFTGLLLVVAYSIMSITAVPFERKKLILLYGFCSASLWACLMANLRQRRQRNG